MTWTISVLPYRTLPNLKALKVFPYGNRTSIRAGFLFVDIKQIVWRLWKTVEDVKTRPILYFVSSQWRLRVALISIWNLNWNALYWYADDHRGVNMLWVILNDGFVTYSYEKYVHYIQIVDTRPISGSTLLLPKRVIAYILLWQYTNWENWTK